MRTEGLEHLIPNQGIAGSSPAGVANEIKELDDILRLKKCDARIKDAARWTAETCA